MAQQLHGLSERDCLRGLISKQFVPLLLLFGFGFVIHRQAATLDFTQIFHAVEQITWPQWTCAAVATTVSFWTVGRMDVVVHRLLNTGTPNHQAQISGIASVATAQLTGFGLLVGTLARWRTLKSATLWQAAKITATVSISFMVALAALAAVMVLIAPPDIAYARAFAALTLGVVLTLSAATMWRPKFLFAIRLPSMRGQLAMVMLAFLDTVAAAATLYVLIPSATLPDPVHFYTIFLLALGAGLLGTTPGGVGPFEFFLILCLPTMAEPELMAAIVAYRIVYFACPAGLAFLVLIFGLGPFSRNSPKRPSTPSLRPAMSSLGRPVATSALSFTAPRAESGLLRQGEFELLFDRHERPAALVAETGQSLIMYADPLGSATSVATTIRDLENHARTCFRTPSIYKCGPRTAQRARRLGWRLTRIAKEAHVKTTMYDLQSPARRQLRRQLRKAETANVQIIENPDILPLADMRAVTRSWVSHCKGQRGFSIGRFNETYVGAQRVYLAYHAGALVGFVSFHEGWKEWTLDLMCHLPNAPTGTMHALIHRAVLAAQRQGCETVSLAAVPAFVGVNRLPGPIGNWISGFSNPGLARFKSCFATCWVPLYLAAPSRIGLGLAALDLIDRITRPRTRIESD